MDNLATAEVRSGPKSVVGLLLFEARGLAVLVNRISDQAYLGPVRHFLDNWKEPEAEIRILPIDELKIIGRRASR